MRVGSGRYFMNGLCQLLSKAFTECCIDIAGLTITSLAINLSRLACFRLTESMGTNSMTQSANTWI